MGISIMATLLSQYDQLLKHTIIVADTGEVDTIASIKPRDATTNPSLITKAASKPEYAELINSAIKSANGDLSLAMDQIYVNFGIEITKIVPGYVSTEVDARLSFDTEATIAKAHKLIALYKANGVDKSRILIKIAATWEGIKAAEILEKEGITCNLTLLFSMAQAIACADAGCTLISPFVGRILELTGCDRLTISPGLIAELQASHEPITKKLCATAAVDMDIPKIDVDEKSFRWLNAQDAMATQKLAEGIRGFTGAILELETIIQAKMDAEAK